jgi:type IV secretory pathway VirB2 component (pilin)
MNNQNHQSMHIAKKHKSLLLAALGTALMLAANVALADTSTGTDYTGDGICQLVTLLKGKTLFGIAVLGMLGGGLPLVFGAEMTDGVKTAVKIVFVVGLIVSFASILSMAFASAGIVSC